MTGEVKDTIAVKEAYLSRIIGTPVAALGDAPLTYWGVVGNSASTTTGIVTEAPAADVGGNSFVVVGSDGGAAATDNGMAGGQIAIEAGNGSGAVVDSDGDGSDGGSVFISGGSNGDEDGEGSKGDEGRVFLSYSLLKTGAIGYTIVGADGTGLNDEADLYLGNTGVLGLKEASETPTAVADHGKIYTKADNKLYFQDGAGVEHEIAYAV